MGQKKRERARSIFAWASWMDEINARNSVDRMDRVARGSFRVVSLFFSLSFSNLILEWGRQGDVQRGGSRLDGPVTSRDKVGRRLCLLARSDGGTHVRPWCDAASSSRSLSLYISPSILFSRSPLSLPLSLVFSLYPGLFHPPSSASLFLTRTGHPTRTQRSPPRENGDETAKPLPVNRCISPFLCSLRLAILAKTG